MERAREPRRRDSDVAERKVKNFHRCQAIPASIEGATAIGLDGLLKRVSLMTGDSHQRG